MTDKNKSSLNRRDFIAGLAGIPVFGGLLAAILAKGEHLSNDSVLSDIGFEFAVQDSEDFRKPLNGQQIRLAIIGVGSRGQNILESLGYWEQAEGDIHYGDLNISLDAVCDVYDVHARLGINRSQKNVYRQSGAPFTKAKRFKDYRAVLASKDIDAVIISTPDHWHAQMIVDAAEAGKHIYCEKCLTRTIEEAFQVRDTLQKKDIVFQYGHQNRQQKSYQIARKILQSDILGKITVIKTHTNRNKERSAWVRHLDKQINAAQVDWQQWLGPAAQTPFSADRFFGWQKWFEYSGGLPAHMFSHEYDAINQILDLGIPASVMATGGIYYWKDARDTPDVFQALFEYPERELILTYDATLSSSSTGLYESGAKVKEILGSDAWMRMGLNLEVIADRHSNKYKYKLDRNMISPDIPFLTYYPGRSQGQVDAVTSASEKYYAGQGLVYTYENGKKIDVTYLHLREWINAIRNGKKPSGSVQSAFEDAITCLMATKSYREKRVVGWDKENEKVI